MTEEIKTAEEKASQWVKENVPPVAIEAAWDEGKPVWKKWTAWLPTFCIQVFLAGHAEGRKDAFEQCLKWFEKEHLNWAGMQSRIKEELSK